MDITSPSPTRRTVAHPTPTITHRDRPRSAFAPAVAGRPSQTRVSETSWPLNGVGRLPDPHDLPHADAARRSLPATNPPAEPPGALTCHPPDSDPWPKFPGVFRATPLSGTQLKIFRWDLRANSWNCARISTLVQQDHGIKGLPMRAGVF